MKIIRKPKMSKMECKRCRAIFKPKLRNLKKDKLSKIKDRIICPICKTWNLAVFEGGEEDGA